jgi:hypothetical protein
VPILVIRGDNVMEDSLEEVNVLSRIPESVLFDKSKEPEILQLLNADVPKNCKFSGGNTNPPLIVPQFWNA